MSYERVYAGETSTLRGKLETYGGAAVALSQISDVRLTLVDAATGATVNERDADTNHIGNLAGANITIGTSDGIVEWQAQKADTTLLDDLSGGEDHQAELKITFNAGEGERVEIFRHRIYCASFLGLTDQDEVDLIIGKDPNRSDEQRFLVDFMIDAVTARLEAETGRIFLKATEEDPAFEYFSPGENCGAVDLTRWPVTDADILEIKEDSDSAFGTAVTAVDATAYGMTTPYSLRRKSGFWLEGVKALRVKHTGGMARHTGGVPAHVRHAVALQVATLWQNRDHLGIQAVSIQGQSVTTYFKGGFIPELKAVLPLLRRNAGAGRVLI